MSTQYIALKNLKISLTLLFILLSLTHSAAHTTLSDVPFPLQWSTRSKLKSLDTWNPFLFWHLLGVEFRSLEVILGSVWNKKIDSLWYCFCWVTGLPCQIFPRPTWQFLIVHFYPKVFCRLLNAPYLWVQLFLW